MPQGSRCPSPSGRSAWGKPANPPARYEKYAMCFEPISRMQLPYKVRAALPILSEACKLT
jgi:hypothetical protein